MGKIWKIIFFLISKFFQILPKNLFFKSNLCVSEFYALYTLCAWNTNFSPILESGSLDSIKNEAKQNNINNIIKVYIPIILLGIMTYFAKPLIN